MTDKPLVLLTWLDSGQPTSGWQWLSTYQPVKPIKCASVGWLIQDDSDIKVLAQSFGDIDRDDDVQAMGIVRIPTACVVSIEELGEVEQIKEAAE